MAYMQKKFYHVHAFDSRSYLEYYFSDKPSMVFGDDSLKFPMMSLHYVFRRGFIYGNLLIDISNGSFIHHLYSASNIFNDIIIMKFNEKSAMEVRRWLGDRTGAFNWSHTKTAFAELEGKSEIQNKELNQKLAIKHLVTGSLEKETLTTPVVVTSYRLNYHEEIQNKELNLKMSIKQIVTANLETETLTPQLVLPLADCIISAWLLDVISKDQEDYMRNLEKISKLLRRGGHLILIGVLNTTYVTAAGEKFHVCKYDESFVRSALSKVGFVIDYCAAQRRKNVSDLIDYSHIVFITAHKEK